MTVFWAIVILGVLLLLWLNRHHIFRRRPFVVLVHGWLSSCEGGPLKYLIKHLKSAGFKVVCFNLDFLDKILLVDPVASAEKLREGEISSGGLRKMALVGHSLGGLIAKAFAIEHSRLSTRGG